MGGHCRVGLEDNIHFAFDRSELATNGGLMDRLGVLAATFGRPLASPTRARELLGLGAPAASVTPFSYTVVLDEAEEAIAG
jgi:3-keto-5-aminohexanoate cleavage enzyme